MNLVDRGGTNDFVWTLARRLHIEIPGHANTMGVAAWVVESRLKKCIILYGTSLPVSPSDRDSLVSLDGGFEMQSLQSQGLGTTTNVFRCGDTIVRGWKTAT